MLWTYVDIIVSSRKANSTVSQSRLNVHCGSAQADIKYKLVSLAFNTETLQVAPTLNSIIISQHDVLVWK